MLHSVNHLTAKPLVTSSIYNVETIFHRGISNNKISEKKVELYPLHLTFAAMHLNLTLPKFCTISTYVLVFTCVD